MAPLELSSYVLHSVFAGFWTGSVLFVAWAVLPLARTGDLGVEPLRTVAGKLTTVSRLSALVLLATGIHMALVRYTPETLTGTLGGSLVIAMVLLWFALAATVEVGAGKLVGGTGRDKVREPARDARRLFQVASLCALLLLVASGLLSAHTLGFL